MFFYFVAQYDEFTAVNNRGGGQLYWPPPLINLTTHISSRLSPISATLTISDLKTRFHATEQLHTTPLPISTWRACRRPAPLFSLRFTASPTPTCPIKRKSGRRAQVAPLYSPSPPPPPRAPSQRGRRRSWVGINMAQVAVIYVHHPLLSPRPRHPRQHLSHHQIQTCATVSPPSPSFSFQCECLSRHPQLP